MGHYPAEAAAEHWAGAVKPLWSLAPFSTVDKWIELLTPEGEVFARIDYDDVDHPAVKRRARNVVEILNQAGA